MTKGWTVAEIELVKELAAKGVSAQRIGARLGRNSRSVREMSIQLGVPTKTKTELRQSFGLRPRFSVASN